MRRLVKRGITTGELDAIGEDTLARHGARSAPREVYQFPACNCISVNEEIVHGIPGDRVIGPFIQHHQPDRAEGTALDPLDRQAIIAAQRHRFGRMAVQDHRRQQQQHAGKQNQRGRQDRESKPNGRKTDLGTVKSRGGMGR